MLGALRAPTALDLTFSFLPHFFMRSLDTPQLYAILLSTAASLRLEGVIFFYAFLRVKSPI
jgi:hypothetical protein